MKRWIPWIIFLAMLLAGCAGPEQSAPAEPDEAAEQSAPAETPEPQPYPILGQTRLEDCTLSVHYVEAGVYYYYPLPLEGLLADEGDERDTQSSWKTSTSSRFWKSWIRRNCRRSRTWRTIPAGSRRRSITF